MGDASHLAEEQLRALDRLSSVAKQLRLYLAGGTGIGMHLHHRISRDIDLFSEGPELDLEHTRDVFSRLEDVTVVSLTDATLAVRFGAVPVDVVKYPYALLNPLESAPGGFPVASLGDLATMKLSAVARRGIRRDFWDLHQILTQGTLTLEQSLKDYVRRFGVKQSDVYHVLRSLTYFEDAEADPLLPAGLGEQKWSQIREWFTIQVPQLLRQELGWGSP